MNHYRITVEPISDEAIEQYGKPMTMLASGFVLSATEDIGFEGMPEGASNSRTHTELAGAGCAWHAVEEMIKALHENYPEEFTAALLCGVLGEGDEDVEDETDSGRTLH